MKQLCRILEGTFGVIMCFVMPVQGQTLEERIKAIETNVQRLQKEMEELKSKVDSSTSQRSDSTDAPPSLNPQGLGLDLSSFKVGETLGENLVIQADQNGDKYVSCSKGGGVVGKLELSSIRLSNKSEVVISADWNSKTWSLIIASTGSSIRIASTRFGLSIEFGDERGKKDLKLRDIGWRERNAVNDMKISIDGNTASLYINDRFVSSHTLRKPETEYTNLIVSGIQDVYRLFRVKWKNL